MKKVLLAVLLAMVVAIGTASAANYIYMKIDAKGVGYKNMEVRADTNPENEYKDKIALSELETGTGLVAKERYEITVWARDTPDGEECKNNTIYEKKEVDFEYMPVVYQNESYDFKWTEKKCVKNYYIGSVVDAFFTKAEKLQKSEEAKANETFNTMTVQASVVGKAHIGVKSVDPESTTQVIFEGHQEWVGVFDIDSYIETKENCSSGKELVDWLGCP